MWQKLHHVPKPEVTILVLRKCQLRLQLFVSNQVFLVVVGAVVEAVVAAVVPVVVDLHQHLNQLQEGELLLLLTVDLLLVRKLP